MGTSVVVELSGLGWQDLNTLSGVPIGTAVDIQNRTSGPIYITVSSVVPSESFEGFAVPANLEDVASIPSGQAQVWIRGDGPVNVQTPSPISFNASRPPEGVYSGTRALTVQFYTEANVKNGRQFEASTFTESFPGLASSGYVVRTGNDPVVLKGRTISVSGLGLKLEMFINPTYTGGTPIPIYTLNHRNSLGTGVQILAAVTVTNDGLKVACDKYVFGSNLQGGVSVSSSTLFTEAPGLEMILPANSVFYFKSTSLDTDPQRVFSYNTWYEGPTDLPLL